MPSDVARCAPGFDRLLRERDREALDLDPHVIYGVWPDLTLAYANAAWFRFARSNRGAPAIPRDWSLGASLPGAWPEVVRGWYEHHFLKVLHDGEPWSFEYPCDGPRVRRTFRQIVYPLGRGEGLLVVNAQIVAVQVDPPEAVLEATSLQAYRGAHGYLLQCCHCRRVRHPGPPPHWDWIAELIEGPAENTSHGLCERCLEHAYLGLRHLTERG